DLTAQFDQHRAHLGRRQRRNILVRASDVRRHQRLLDPGVAASWTRDLAGLLLRLERVAAVEPALEFVLGVAAQREPDHRVGPPGTLPLLTLDTEFHQSSINLPSRVLIDRDSTMPTETPSPWVQRFAPQIRAGGRVLDLAAGAGRHTRLLLDMGLNVTAVDRNVDIVRNLAGLRCEVREIDLET